MTKIKKIKFYSGPGRYLNLRAKSNGHKPPCSFLFRFFARAFDFFYLTGLALIKFLKLAKNFALDACFYVGNAIFGFVSGSYRIIKQDALNTKGNIAKRLRLALSPQFAKALALFLLVSAVAWAGFGSLRLIARGLELKNAVLGTAALGNRYLGQARDALTQQDFQAAGNRFQLASRAFSRGQSQLEDSGLILNQLLSLLPQKQDAAKLLSAARLIAVSGQQFISLEADLKMLKLTPAGVSSAEKSVSEALRDMDQGIAQSSASLNQAYGLVSSVDANNLPPQNRESFVTLKGELQAAQLALANFTGVFHLAKSLLSGNKNILVLFENNNELRPTGGFMGTFGSMEIRDGAIGKINVSSIYDLDGQLIPVIQPPQPVLNLGGRWYLRDSNWFADFPFSAEKISQFYEMEGGETPDLIIAMTPDLIIDWLKIVGPVSLPNYGLTLTADNFVEQTQAQSTLSNNLPTNSPKQVFVDLVPSRLHKLCSACKAHLPQIVQSLENN